VLTLRAIAQLKWGDEERDELTTMPTRFEQLALMFAATSYYTKSPVEQVVLHFLRIYA
jgi:hypothetical protein